MSEKDLPPSGKEPPPSFDLKFWELEKDINSLKETELLKDEEKIFEELLSKYGGLDENMQKEIQAFKLLVDSTVAEGIKKNVADLSMVVGKLAENSERLKTMEG